MSPPRVEIGVSYQILFTPDENADLMETLKEMGYSEDSSGIKEFILDSLDDSEPDEPTLGDRVTSFIEEHPEAVDRIKQLGGDFIKRKFKF